MNGFIIRHAERISYEPYHLTAKGKERAQKYATVLYKLFYEKFGNVPEAIYLKPFNFFGNYGIQCQQTMMPMAFEKNLPVFHFQNEGDLDISHNNVIICCEHKMIVHLVQVHFKIKGEPFPFFWTHDNFCTVIQIHQGHYAGAFPMYMDESETEIFQRFMNRVPFQQYCRFLYKKQETHESFHHLPRQVLDFLEFFLSMFPHLSEKIQIFGGWIRNILLNEIDPNIHDIDVVFPLEYSVFKEFLDWVEEHPSCIDLNIYLRRTVREEEGVIVAHFNFIENDKTIALDMSNYEKCDFDFTCNSGYIKYPSLDDIGFKYKRGERDLLEHRLVPCSSSVGLDRYLKMLKLGFQIVDTSVQRDLKEKIYQEKSSLPKRDMIELCNCCSIEIPPEILALPQSQYVSILLLGDHNNTVKPTPSYQTWLKELDDNLDPCATVTTGIYHPDNIITHTIQYLVQHHPSREVVWVRWSDHKEQVSEDTIKEFRKSVPLGTMKTVSNILFRTDYLLEEEHDKIFVFPGKEATEMETLTVNLMNRSFERVPLLEESGSKESDILDCLILGGGVAGITCFKELWEQEYRNIAVVEATPTLGGRVKVIEWEGNLVSQGACWIQGINDNDFYEKYIKGQFDCVETDFSSLQFMNYHNDPLQKEIHQLKVIIEHSEHKTEDVSIQSYFEKQGFSTSTLSKFMAEKFMIDFEYGEESKHVAFRNIAPDIHKNHFDNPSVYVKGGMQQILENMVPEEARDRIHCNQDVVKVLEEESKDFFTIETKSGKSYKARNVVCTFSLGFLQKNPSILPSLAWKKIEIERSLTMAHYDTVYVKVDAIFWDRSKEFILFFHDMDRYAITMNLGHDKYYPGEPILVLFLFSQHAKEFEMLSSDEEKMERIKEFIAPDTHYNIVSFCTKSWSRDEFTYGSFSYRYYPDFAPTDSPFFSHNKNIYFAGEHMDKNYNGYTQGAYYSAKKVAKQILYK
jgi:monoamine oxidase